MVRVKEAGLRAAAGRLSRGVGVARNIQIKRLEGVEARLRAVGPERVLARGYSVTTDAASGEVVYDQKLGFTGTSYPSITLAGEHLFASSDSGDTVVFIPGREYKEVARNSLAVGFRSTPVFNGSRMYIRTLEDVVCIGK